MLEPMEEKMPEKPMTLQEELAVLTKAAELRQAGKKDEAMALTKTLPLPPFLAKIMKEKAGDYLINSGWNLSAAEAEFGKDWLSK
jgi:hypothetical protein